MPGFSDAAENAILALIFNATTWASVAQNASSSPFTNIDITGHTADPGDAGTALTSECSYTGYARDSLARTTGGWTAPSGGSTSNAALVELGACTAGSNTMTHFGLAWGGTNTLIGSGALNSNLVIGAGVTPTAQIGAITVALT